MHHIMQLKEEICYDHSESIISSKIDQLYIDYKFASADRYISKKLFLHKYFLHNSFFPFCQFTRNSAI